MPAALVLAFSVAVSTETASAAAELVATVNRRDLGSIGWRRVRIELLNDGATVRTFVVTNLWRRTAGGEVRTLFHLEEPQGLAGTSYLEIERPAGASEFEVYLNLPTSGGRVLAIAPENLGAGLLGSDFGYSDVRMLLPSSAAYRLAGRTTMLGRPAVILEATPLAGAQLPWTRARYYVDPAIAFVLGADMFGGDEVKRMRVEALACQGGVWTASRMIMTSARGRATRLTLLDAAFHVARVAPSVFDVGGLVNAGVSIAPLAKELAASGKGR